MARGIRLRKQLPVKRIVELRRSEKSAEFLEAAWKSFQKKQTAKALSILYSAATVYGTKFNAILFELNAAKRKGLLPQNFQIPRNTIELKALQGKTKKSE